MDETALYEINIGQNIIEIELPGGTRGERGDKGDKGDTGEQGPQGIQGEPGPKGDKGDKGDPGVAGERGETGPANTLSIGTVTRGAEASAEITGEAPNQTLNLVLPQGIKGDTGDTGEQGPQGPKGDKGDKGDKGAIGPANTLTIGTVERGEEADAEITGEAPNQTLNLVLPKGDAGAKGDTGDTGPKGDTGEQGPQGPKGDKGDKGDTGNDGFSPTVTSSKSGKTTTLTITDANGTSTATILDGEDGPTYTAGSGIDITNNVISNTQTSAQWGNITGTLSNQTDLQTALSSKQDTLVSGTNIKTINNLSILGSGNIDIQGGSGSISDGPLVVDSIRTKNMFDSSTIVQGEVDGGSSRKSTKRVSSRQTLWLKEGTYTFSTNMTSTYEFLIDIKAVAPPTGSTATSSFYSGWQSNTFTFTLTTAGYFMVEFSKADNTDLTPSDISSYNFQLEEGSIATTYSPYQNLNPQKFVLYENLDGTDTSFELSEYWKNFKEIEVYFLTNGWLCNSAKMDCDGEKSSLILTTQYGTGTANISVLSVVIRFNDKTVSFAYPRKATFQSGSANVPTIEASANIKVTKVLGYR